MPNFKKCVFVDDLLALTLYSCLAIVFVLITPFNETYLRVFFVLPLFIFVPGYAFMAALFPGNKEISGMERFTLSFAFSIVLVVFDGYLISLLPWGYRPGPIVISILGMTVFFCIIAIFARKLLNENDQFSFSTKEFIQFIKSNDSDESRELEKISLSPGKRRFFGINKVKVNDLKFYLVDLRKIFFSSGSNNKLILRLLVLIILFSSIQIYLIGSLPNNLHLSSVIISFLGVMFFFGTIVVFISKFMKDGRFSFSIEELIRSIKLGNTSENKSLEKISFSTYKEFLQRFISKVKAKFLEYRLDSDLKNTSLPSDIEKGLIIGLIVAIILVSGMQVYAKVTQEKESFTTLYLLGPDGKAEGYPKESLIDVPLVVTVGIENHELQDVNYILQMKFDGEVINEQSIFLKDGETTLRDMTYTREKIKTGISKLEFTLLKEKSEYSPYRSVHLFLENNNTIDYLDPLKYAEVPVVENSNMELSIGWEFTSNNDIITGSYLNDSGINSSFAYGIVNSFEGNLSDSPKYGEISQNIECKEDTMVLLSAYVKSSSNSSMGGWSQTKYVTVNGVPVWNDGITENEDWEHLIVPVSLHAGINHLSLGLQQTYGEISPVEILWDDVSFKSLADLSSYPSDSSTLEANAPTSTVQPLPAYTNSKTFIVSWNGTDDSGIAYYSIDASTDGINWQNWISNTTDNSSFFTGEENQTYYFRSRAVDNSGNAEPVHSAPDTKTKIYTGTPTIMLDISPNPCKNATNITISSTIPLSSVVCHIGRPGFTPDSGELTSPDGVTWTGGYVINDGDHFNVEVVCTDSYGNQKSIVDQIIVDNSLPDFWVKATPRTIDSGDLKVKVASSVALKKEPSVSISGVDSEDITYLGYSDDEYVYNASIKSEIDEGEHKVSVSGDGLDSETVEGNTTFVVDHAG